jgi:hypothetical protein
MDELRAAVIEAREDLRAETGLDEETLFGARVVEPQDMTARAAHAAGVIEGAAMALGLTALELLDEIDASCDERSG